MRDFYFYTVPEGLAEPEDTQLIRVRARPEGAARRKILAALEAPEDWTLEDYRIYPIVPEESSDWVSEEVP